MSKSQQKFQLSNILLVEVPPQFIALCEASGASPQAALRGMAAMVCGLQGRKVHKRSVMHNLRLPLTVDCGGA